MKNCGCCGAKKWCAVLVCVFRALCAALTSTLFLALVLFVCLYDGDAPHGSPTQTDIPAVTPTDTDQPATNSDSDPEDPHPIRPAEPRDGTLCEIATIADLPYTGDAHTPRVTVRDGNRVLKPGVDYHVTYQGGKDAGVATATVLFEGDYSGMLERTFNVMPKDMTDTEQPRLAQDSFFYTGDEITPYAVIMDGNRKLLEGRDYDLTFVDNVYPGTGKIFVNYKGNYTGHYTMEFLIRVQQCKVHWLMILSLMLFVDAFVVLVFFVKKKKATLIVCAVFGVLSAVLLCLSGCAVCYYVGAANLLVAVAGAAYAAGMDKEKKEPENYFNAGLRRR